MNRKIRDRGRSILTLPAGNHKHLCEDAWQSNQWLFLSPHYSTRLHQKKGDVLQYLFLLSSLPIELERTERPSLSLLIWLDDRWMDSSQLISRWQEALLLAQWPTPSIDHQHNSHCPQIDFWTLSNPGKGHAECGLSLGLFSINRCLKPTYIGMLRLHQCRSTNTLFWRRSKIVLHVSLSSPSRCFEGTLRES